MYSWEAFPKIINPSLASHLLGKRPEGEQPAIVCTEENAKKRNKASNRIFHCETAKRLLEAFGESVQAVLLLHEQQFQAIVEGDSNANRFDLLIHEALEQKQNAKYAYINHLESHGCSF